MEFLFACIAGAVTGVLSAWGIGGGTLLVIYMTVFADIGQQTAQGINLLYFLPTSIAALVSHIKNNLIEWRVAGLSAAAGIPAAIALSLVAMRLETETLRRIFGVFVIAVGVYELFFCGGKKRKNAEKC